jgi:hypothetical protein
VATTQRRSSSETGAAGSIATASPSGGALTGAQSGASAQSGSSQSTAPSPSSSTPPVHSSGASDGGRSTDVSCFVPAQPASHTTHSTRIPTPPRAAYHGPQRPPVAALTASRAAP